MGWMASHRLGGSMQEDFSEKMKISDRVMNIVRVGYDRALEQFKAMHAMNREEWQEWLYENPQRSSAVIMGTLAILVGVMIGIHQLVLFLGRPTSNPETESAAAALQSLKGELQDKSFSAKLSLAYTLLKKKKYDESLLVFNDLSKEVKKNNAKKVFYGMATAAYDKGDYTEALSALFQLSKFFPVEAETEMRLGLIFWKRNFLAESQSHLRKAFELNPNLPSLSEHLALVNQSLEQTRMAQQRFEQRFQGPATKYQRSVRNVAALTRSEVNRYRSKAKDQRH